MNYINHLAGWLEPEQGLKTAKGFVQKILAKPVGEFLENPKTREILELARKVEAWFTQYYADKAQKHPHGHLSQGRDASHHP